MFKFMSSRNSNAAQEATQKLPQAPGASKSPPPQTASAASSQSPPKASFDGNDVVTVKAGETIPFDGRILEGVAMVDESAYVGVSTPALLSDETGRNNVIGGTLIIEGTLKIQRV